MKTFYEHTGTLAEHLVLETPEEFITLMRALDFYALRVPGAPTQAATPEERTERRNLYIEHIRTRCDVLRLEMQAGLARAQRGYASLEFNGDDTEFLCDALYLLASQQESCTKNDSGFHAAYAVTARYLIETEIAEGFAADLAERAPAPQE